MTECYGWYVPTSQKEYVIRVGDKVEIIDAWGIDKEKGIQNGHIAKVTQVGDKYILCRNPIWKIRGDRAMGFEQVKLIDLSDKEELL